MTRIIGVPINDRQSKHMRIVKEAKDYNMNFVTVTKNRDHNRIISFYYDGVHTHWILLKDEFEDLLSKMLEIGFVAEVK